MKLSKLTLKVTLILCAVATFIMILAMMFLSQSALTEVVDLAIRSGSKEVDRLHEIANAAQQSAYVMLFAIVVLLIGIVYYLTRAFATPVNRLANLMHQVTQDKNLSVRADMSGNADLGKIAEAFNTVLAEFETLIGEVHNSVTRLKASTQDLSAVTEQSGENMVVQQSESQQVAAAMNQMAATAQEVSRNAFDAAETVHEAESTATKSAEVAVEAMCAMDNLVSEVDSASGVIHRLETESENIGMVLDVIKGIAEQTNLLALNAAIEAARAGEQGRGFAVVADEVRALAGKTQSSTDEIQSMIEHLQAGSREAVKVMNAAKNLGEAGSAQTEAAAEALAGISGSVKQINDMTTQIASAAEEQTSVANEISGNITSISQITEATVQGSMQTSEATEHLKALAEELQTMLAAYDR